MSSSKMWSEHKNKVLGVFSKWVLNLLGLIILVGFIGMPTMMFLPVEVKTTAYIFAVVVVVMSLYWIWMGYGEGARIYDAAYCEGEMKGDAVHRAVLSEWSTRAIFQLHQMGAHHDLARAMMTSLLAVASEIRHDNTPSPGILASWRGIIMHAVVALANITPELECDKQIRSCGDLMPRELVRQILEGNVADVPLRPEIVQVLREMARAEFNRMSGEEPKP